LWLLRSEFGQRQMEIEVWALELHMVQDTVFAASKIFFYKRI
jgi:hypothetical protein